MQTRRKMLTLISLVMVTTACLWAAEPTPTPTAPAPALYDHLARPSMAWLKQYTGERPEDVFAVYNLFTLRTIVSQQQRMIQVLLNRITALEQQMAVQPVDPNEPPVGAVDPNTGG